jgi:hypothetical protein
MRRSRLAGSFLPSSWALIFSGCFEKLSSASSSDARAALRGVGLKSDPQADESWGFAVAISEFCIIQVRQTSEKRLLLGLLDFAHLTNNLTVASRQDSRVA